jgi:hypothetical protein
MRRGEEDRAYWEEVLHFHLNYGVAATHRFGVQVCAVVGKPIVKKNAHKTPL